MRQKTIVASLLWVIMLGLSNAAMAYTIGFNFVSENQPADTATFTISNPLQNLYVTSENGITICEPNLLPYQAATLSATGTWASYQMPEVAFINGFMALLQTQPAGLWTPLFMWVYVYDSQTNPVMTAAQTDQGLAILLGGGGTSLNFLLSPDLATAGRYELYELYDSTQTNLNTPMLVTITVDPSAVPLPPSLLLLAPGLLGLGVMRRFRQKP